MSQKHFGNSITPNYLQRSTPRFVFSISDPIDSTMCGRRRRNGAQSVRWIVLAEQKEPALIGRKARRRFIKIRIYRQAGRKDFAGADELAATKIRAFSFNTLPRSGDSTVSRITHTRRARPDTAILKLSSIKRKMRPQSGPPFDIKSLANCFFWALLWRVDLF